MKLKNMIEGVVIKNLVKYGDERGWLAEIFRKDEIEARPVMGYVSATKPGVVRGPHEHKNQTDIFAFIGPGSVELMLWDNRKESPTFGEKILVECGENNPTLAIVPPGVVHAYKNVGEIDAWCINLPDKLYKGEGRREEADEIRWENDPNSPFKL